MIEYNPIYSFLSSYYNIQNRNVLDEIIDFYNPQNLFMIDMFVMYLNQKYQKNFDFIKPKLLQVMVLA